MILDVDYALVGGGLQNGLLALALRAARPAARLALVERGATLGGNHTWCFHAGDLPATAAPWIEPLVAHRWPGYDVAFPALRRHVASPYACIPAARLHQVVSAALGAGGQHLLLEHEAIAVEPRRVLLRRIGGAGAELELRAAAVIDARGPDRGDLDAHAGFQKFVGLELRTAAPHGLTAPLLMDAEVAQLDGFRFLYVLPLAGDRLLVEDTVLGDTAYLDVATLRAQVLAYCASRGWRDVTVLRQESGVLPLPWRAELAAPGRPLVAGYQGGWFHPVTGYSFPVALRLAEAIAATPPDELPGPRLAALWRRHRRQLAFAFRLNAMLFHWFPPERRFHVLERFYRLPERTIRNFYALELSLADQARFFLGRPPRGLAWRTALTGWTPAARAAGAPR